jgi:hypothetical protein
MAPPPSTRTVDPAAKGVVTKEDHRINGSRETDSAAIGDRQDALVLLLLLGWTRRRSFQPVGPGKPVTFGEPRSITGVSAR